MAMLNRVSLPDELFAAIQRRAGENGITVEEQVVRDLALAEDANGHVADAALLDEIRRERESVAAKGVFLTEEFLRRAKSWGRE